MLNKQRKSKCKGWEVGEDLVFARVGGGEVRKVTSDKVSEAASVVRTSKALWLSEMGSQRQV